MTWSRVIVFGLLLVAMGARAEACLNDQESATHEREFRSSYGRDNLAESGRKRSGMPYTQGILIGGGVLLLGASFMMVRKHTRRGLDA